MRGLLRRDEPEDVLTELVDALADGTVPMLILGILVISIGSYVLTLVDSPFVLAATVLGSLACCLKIAVILRHRRFLRTGRRPGLAETRRREIWHAVSTLTVAGSVGFLTSAIFALPDVSLHLPATSLVFGYCAGVINRVSNRPRIAMGALFCAGVPSVVSAAVGGTPAHLVLAAVFAAFLSAAIQSVHYAYETMRRGVTLRLQMETLARRDPLTGLHNRLGLREAFDALARDGRGAVAIHAFDLDGFKAVNDRFGHSAGDRLLAVLSERVQSVVSKGTIVARTGGDEFVLVQLDVEDGAEARGLAERIHEQLTRPYDLGLDRPVRVGLSLGYAMGRLPEAHLDQLSRQADAATYAAKHAGGGIRAHGEAAAPAPAEMRRAASS